MNRHIMTSLLTKTTAIFMIIKINASFITTMTEDVEEMMMMMVLFLSDRGAAR